MRTTLVSTFNLLNTPRTGINRMQAGLSRLSTEIATGRHADIGMALGSGVSRSIELRRISAGLTSMIDGNATVVARISLTETTLARVGDDADSFLQSLVSISDSPNATAVVSLKAKAGLDSVIDALNVSDGRRFLFGGINSAVRPINSMDFGPAAAIDTAFQTRFGFPPGDPLAAGIPAADMADFLDNEFAALFADPNWGAIWSNASSEAVQSRISGNEMITSSVSANQAAFRNLLQAFAMVGQLGVGTLNSEALGEIVNKASAMVGQSISDVTALRAGLGTIESRAQAASDRMARERDVIDLRTSALESVDPYEAKVRFDQLSTQIEMSYALTVRLSSLSILNYA